MPLNSAAYLLGKDQPLEVKSAPYTAPGNNEIVIKNAALAINPIDWAKQSMGPLLPWLIYPNIPGSDLAGEVFEVGASVTRFHSGDRVVAAALGGGNRNNPAGSAFQHYTVVSADMTCKIPDAMPFEDACVLPLGLCTAASGLFMKSDLGLQLPTSPPQKQTGETLLVWSGASSVGSNAIQLAVAAGYEVFTTCSPSNNEYVKGLGASQTFDYKSESVVQDILSALRDGNKALVGAMAIGNVQAPGNGASAAEACLAIAAAMPASLRTGRKHVALAMHFPEVEVPEGVQAKFIVGDSLTEDEVGRWVWGEFLEEALRKGEYKPVPAKKVVGRGLEKLQDGLAETVKPGAGRGKVVVGL